MPAQAASETSIPEYRFTGSNISGGSNNGLLIGLTIAAVVFVAWLIYRGKN